MQSAGDPQRLKIPELVFLPAYKGSERDGDYMVVEVLYSKRVICLIVFKHIA
jgi:hypothetical protein